MTNNSQERNRILLVSDVEIHFIGFVTGSDRYALKVTHASLSDSLSNHFLKGGVGTCPQYKRKCNSTFTALNVNKMCNYQKERRIGDSSRFGIKLQNFCFDPYWLCDLGCNTNFLSFRAIYFTYYTGLLGESNK